MKVREKALKRLAGCSFCKRKCRWNGNVAAPDGAAQESGKNAPYKCNPTSHSSK